MEAIDSGKEIESEEPTTQIHTPPSHKTFSPNTQTVAPNSSDYKSRKLEATNIDAKPPESDSPRVWNQGAKARIRTSLGLTPQKSSESPYFNQAYDSTDLDGEATKSELNEAGEDDVRPSGEASVEPQTIVRTLSATGTSFDAVESDLIHAVKHGQNVPAHNGDGPHISKGKQSAELSSLEKPIQTSRSISDAHEVASGSEPDEEDEDDSRLLINCASPSQEQETDEMLVSYSKSDSINENVVQKPKMLTDSGDFTAVNAMRGFEERPLNKRLMLDQLPESYHKLQVRYFQCAEGQSSSKSARELVICLVCREKGHIGNNCPKLICSHCHAEKDHFWFGCPKVRRCTKCRGQGHEADMCPSKLKASKADGKIPCLQCSSLEHLDKDCPRIFQTYEPPAEAAVRKVGFLPVACYVCGGSKHFGADCDLRPKGWTRPLAGWTFSLQNMKTYLTPHSSLSSLEAPRRPPTSKTDGSHVADIDDDHIYLHTKPKGPKGKGESKIDPHIKLKASAPSARKRGGHTSQAPFGLDPSRTGPPSRKSKSSPVSRGRGKGRGAIHKPGRTAAKKAYQQFIR